MQLVVGKQWRYVIFVLSSIHAAAASRCRASDCQLLPAADISRRRAGLMDAHCGACRTPCFMMATLPSLLLHDEVLKRKMGGSDSADKDPPRIFSSRDMALASVMRERHDELWSTQLNVRYELPAPAEAIVAAVKASRAAAIIAIQALSWANARNSELHRCLHS